MAVECTSVESRSLGTVRMEFVCDGKKVEFVIRVGTDTVKTILGEIVQNYERMFGEGPSADGVREWTENLRTFFPRQVGRFLVYQTIVRVEQNKEKR